MNLFFYTFLVIVLNLGGIVHASGVYNFEHQIVAVEAAEERSYGFALQYDEVDDETHTPKILQKPFPNISRKIAHSTYNNPPLSIKSTSYSIRAPPAPNA